MKLTDEQLDLLRHMLGINDPVKAKPEPYRNYAAANPGDPALHELARLGAVEMYSAHGSYEWFRCTDAGTAAALASHKKIRVKRSARIYAKFLDVREAWPDLTFREFLTDPEFAESRRYATSGESTR